MSRAGTPAGNLVPLRPARKCPECGAPADRKTWPFCSRRCADIDLNRWLSGHYRIASAEPGPPGGEDGAPE